MAITPPISPFQADAYYIHSKDSGLLVACPDVAKPCADDSARLTVIDESNGEKFALFKGKKDAQSFGHFDPKNQAWHERPFHLISSVDMKMGTVNYIYRNPTALSHDDGYLFIKLDNGQEVRAHIRPGPLFFAENSPESHSDSIFSSLHGIASMDAYPNMVLNIRIPYMDMVPVELSDRFEKKQAADYLETTDQDMSGSPRNQNHAGSHCDSKGQRTRRHDRF